MKKTIAIVLALAMMLCLFAGCGNKQEKASGEKTVVTIVVADYFGDRSFFDSAKEGGDRLAKDFSNVELKTIECGGEAHDTQMRNAGDVSDIVVCVGWEFYEIENVAPEYPDVKWIWIDNATSAPIDNVLNITYAQNEGSFLAGYIAAAMSTSGVVGAVGGEDSDVINDFLVGYKQGAEYCNKDIKVEFNYANTYDDPAMGKECAKALNDKGADVVFQVAGKTGDGVFEAAQEGGFYAIGVDCDQKYIDEDTIICSMMKKVGNSVYDAIAKYLNGDAGMFGTTWVADMSADYLGIGYGEDGAAQQISDEIKAEVEQLRAKIVSGEIAVDTTR